MKKHIWIITLVVVLILIGIGLFIFFANIHKISQNLSECSIDSDCVKVKTTCCGCEMGGQEKCVSSQLVRVYQDNLKACPNPEKLICPAMYNCEIESCRCFNGTCVAN